MTRKRLALALLVGLLVTAAATPAHAADARPGLAESWWSWFATWAQSVLGSGPEPDIDPWGNKVGISIDPFGQPSYTTGQADVGPAIDPWGGSHTTTGNAGQADSGPFIDPWGGQ